MVLKEGWLNRQMDQVSKNVESWPDWMKRAGGIAADDESEITSTEQQKSSEETNEPQGRLNL